MDQIIERIVDQIKGTEGNIEEINRMLTEEAKAAGLEITQDQRYEALADIAIKFLNAK